VKIWDANSGECLRELVGHKHKINSVAYSPHAAQLASGRYEKTVKIGDANSGQCLHTLLGHSARVRTVSFKSKTQLISAGIDGTMRLWDINQGICLAVWISSTDGWAMYLAQGLPRYKSSGNSRHLCWHSAGLCRYNLGDLEQIIPNLRMEDKEKLPF